MCVCWPKFCVASHVVWSILYIVIGAIQLIAGIFFLISLPVFKIGSNIWTGVWNVVAGVGGAVFSCVGDLNPNKQQVLLYLTISVLVLNVINLVILELGEWRILMPDTIKAVIEKHNLQTLVFYARMTTSISTGVAVVTSFFDAQFMFCWLEHNLRPRNRLDHNETISDIEYIIPRVKSGSNNSQGETGKTVNNSHGVYNQYAQSWVFDTETVGSSQSDSPYSKLQQFNGSKTVILKRKTKRPDCEQISNSISASTKSKSQPMVLVEDTTNNKETTNNNNNNTVSGRQLQFMTSFSRTPSPVAGGHNSDSSSPSSNPPMIYECLERLTEPSVYRSRLNTALVVNAERTPQCVSPRPHSVVLSDQVQYASLMVELEKTIVAKFPSQKTPDIRSEIATRHSSRRASSRDDSQYHTSSNQTVQSDTDFSKELEAALQLIQDLESPNTTETPSDHPASLSYQHTSNDDHRTPRCLISQMTETSIDHGSSFDSSDGKKHSQLQNIQTYTQTYDMGDPEPTDKNNDAENLTVIFSNDYDNNDMLEIEINNLNCTSNNYLTINNNCDFSIHNSVKSEKNQESNHLEDLEYLKEASPSILIKLKSMFKQKKQKPMNEMKLEPEIESSILKSESLVHLSDAELVQRYNRDKTMHRKIEEKVWQRINGASSSDTYC